jgi:hypothetical protein
MRYRNKGVVAQEAGEQNNGSNYWQWQWQWQYLLSLSRETC